MIDSPTNKDLQDISNLLSSSEESNVILGATLAESLLGWEYVMIYNNIGDTYLNSIVLNTPQEEICTLCEEDILGCSRSSYHYQCEGSKCEEANELFIENYLLELL